MVKAVSRLLALDCEIVGSVADGSALLEAAQRLQPDVIVLDVNLPNVRSLEACREVTRVNPTTKVIMSRRWTTRPPARRSSRREHLPSSQK
jgi:DNA-binding NarL/FixJ family response regulator